MSHFYGRIQGHRGEATRCGTKQSGLVASASGWNVGGKVVVTHHEGKGDCVEFQVNGGSNLSHHESIVRVWEDGRVEFSDARMALAYAAIKGEGGEDEAEVVV